MKRAIQLRPSTSGWGSLEAWSLLVAIAIHALAALLLPGVAVRVPDAVGTGDEVVHLVLFPASPVVTPMARARPGGAQATSLAVGRPTAEDPRPGWSPSELEGGARPGAPAPGTAPGGSASERFRPTAGDPRLMDLSPLRDLLAGEEDALAPAERRIAGRARVWNDSVEAERIRKLERETIVIGGHRIRVLRPAADFADPLWLEIERSSHDAQQRRILDERARAIRARSDSSRSLSHPRN